MKDSIVMVTGAGSGIGRAVSIAFLEVGYQVVLTGRKLSSLKQTKQMSTHPVNAHAFPADVTDPQAVAKLFKKISKKFGRLDLVFNNAGINITGPIEDITPLQWKSVIDTNLTGAFLCTQQAFKIMKDQDPQGGRIINNGSISAYVPRPEATAYTCSKHAITGLTRSTSLEGRKYNICCGQIDIGNVETPMAHRMKTGTLQADGSTQIEPTFGIQHVVDAVLYMAALPLEANVQFMTVMASQMPFIGRG